MQERKETDAWCCDGHCDATAPLAERSVAARSLAEPLSPSTDRVGSGSRRFILSLGLWLPLGQHVAKLLALVQLRHDIAPADEFAVDEQLSAPTGTQTPQKPTHSAGCMRLPNRESSHRDCGRLFAKKRTHARTHARMPAHTQAHSHEHTHTNACALIRALARMYSAWRSHARTHLRDGRPLAVLLDALANLGVLQDVDAGEFDVLGVQNADDLIAGSAGRAKPARSLFACALCVFVCGTCTHARNCDSHKTNCFRGSSTGRMCLPRASGQFANSSRSTGPRLLIAIEGTHTHTQ
jgi:hypothetical protein